jgi:hypothetical protein
MYSLRTVDANGRSNKQCFAITTLVSNRGGALLDLEMKLSNEVADQREI